jgi:hypothetical protein
VGGVAATNGPSGGNVLIAAIVRPLMLVVWVLVLWGTLYGAALAYAVAANGWGALGRAVSGEDPMGGVISMIAAGFALVAWSALGAAALVGRSRNGKKSSPA